MRPPAEWGPSGHCRRERHGRCAGMVALAWPAGGVEVAVWACPCHCHATEAPA